MDDAERMELLKDICFGTAFQYDPERDCLVRLNDLVFLALERTGPTGELWGLTMTQHSGYQESKVDVLWAQTNVQTDQVVLFGTSE